MKKQESPAGYLDLTSQGWSFSHSPLQGSEWDSEKLLLSLLLLGCILGRHMSAPPEKQRMF